MTRIEEILSELIRYESVTPNDAGCQEYIMRFLSNLGFDCQRFDKPPVANFFARLGNTSPLFVFAGHTDVVDPGNVEQWLSPPFCLEERDNILYGRGAVDMKGSIACMMLAVERLINSGKKLSGSLGFLITSGEEGDLYQLGTPYVMKQLQQQGIQLNYCLVGEPSSLQSVGDTIKVGRRGSLSAHINLTGKQGHVAYPHLAENPIHAILPALSALTQIHFDEGNDYFPPTTLQVTQIQSGGQGNNIIPGSLNLHLNIRYCTEQTADTLKSKVMACFERFSLSPSIQWVLSGEPFLTQKGNLLDVCTQVIQEHTGKKPDCSTSGGTSDGRFIAPYGVEVIELGLINASIHQVNEHTTLKDLKSLTEIYEKVCLQLVS